MMVKASAQTLDIYSVKKHELGHDIHSLIRELYPICRSITGNGVRRTLEILRKHIDLTIREVPSGTPAFDWIVPKEWNINDAYIKDESGRKVVDFKNSNLHVVGYSHAVKKKLHLDELKKHIHVDHQHPEWIPSRSNYYRPHWGFCMAATAFNELVPGEYEVFIDSTLQDGFLTYGEFVIPGASSDEVLISTHICHPSLCNDNLSGVAVATLLAKHVASRPHKLTYRFLFIPTTIGAIVWLSRNAKSIGRIKFGLVLSCLGDNAEISYKKTRNGSAGTDLVCEYVLSKNRDAYRIIEFSPCGGDERQYCSQGFNLPVGALMRSLHGSYPQYHTSADDLECVKPERLAESLCLLVSIMSAMDMDRVYASVVTHCEPHLIRRGISLSGEMPFGGSREQPVLWLLNYADGTRSLIDIASRSNIDLRTLFEAAGFLEAHGLIKEVDSCRE